MTKKEREAIVAKLTDVIHVLRTSPATLMRNAIPSEQSRYQRALAKGRLSLSDFCWLATRRYPELRDSRRTGFVLRHTVARELWEMGVVEQSPEKWQLRLYVRTTESQP